MDISTSIDLKVPTLDDAGSVEGDSSSSSSFSAEVEEMDGDELRETAEEETEEAPAPSSPTLGTSCIRKGCIESMPASSFERLNKLLSKTAMYSNFINEQIMDDCGGDDYHDHHVGGGKGGSSSTSPPNRKRSRGDSSGSEVPPLSSLQQPKYLVGTLFPHQLVAVRWLSSLYKNGVNCILADEMGLGKTIEVIGFFAELMEHNVLGPHLVVAPLSTIENWQCEFQNWLPTLPVMVYHGDREARRRMRRVVRRRHQLVPAKLKRQFRPSELAKRYGGVVITSYEVIMRDAPWLRNVNKYRWNCLVVDEAHRLKNFECKLIRQLRKFPVLARLLLTGTPLQNNLAELWSILNFTVPELFDGLEEFQKWFEFECADEDLYSATVEQQQSSNGGTTPPPENESATHTTHEDNEKTNGAISTPVAPAETGSTAAAADARSQTALMIAKMHHLLRPFLLRRTKIEIPELRLPPKYEIVLRCNLGQQQARSYNTVGCSDRYRNGRLFHLRKVCCHPHLFAEFDPFHDDLRKGDSDAFFSDPRRRMQYRKVLLRDSCKLTVLHRMLCKLKQDNHKVLIFSQMTSVLDIIEDFIVSLNDEEYTYERLDGGKSLAARTISLNAFNKGETFIFLISTRAGGLGVNLCKADTVILFDSDFNPHCDIQAIDRCHRIGQTAPVVVYRLVCSRTVDDVIVTVSLRKLRMERLVIGAGRFNKLQVTEVEESAAQYERERVAVERALMDVMQYTTADVDHHAFDGSGIDEETLDLLVDRQKVIAFCEERKGGGRSSGAGGSGAVCAALGGSGPFAASPTGRFSASARAFDVVDTA